MRASITDRYSPPRPTLNARTGATRSARTGAVTRGMLSSLNRSYPYGTRGITMATRPYYRSYSWWWDPCYHSNSHMSGWGWSFHWGFGSCYPQFRYWYPYFLSNSSYWSSSYHDCWWDTWSCGYESPRRYWWYPTSAYCPTYLYVPSTVFVSEDPAPAEEVEVVAAGGAAPAAESSAAELAEKYVQLGDFYFEAGRFSDAADAYARARTYAPDDAPLHFVLADAAFAVGDYHFAAFLIAEALRLDPTLASAEVDKREFYGEKKLFDEHMRALDDYLEKKPYDASAHLVRGYNLRFSDRPAAAILAFERVLEIAPDHRAARIFLEVLQPEEEKADVIVKTEEALK